MLPNKENINVLIVRNLDTSVLTTLSPWLFIDHPFQRTHVAQSEPTSQESPSPNITMSNESIHTSSGPKLQPTPHFSQLPLWQIHLLLVYMIPWILESKASKHISINTCLSSIMALEISLSPLQYLSYIFSIPKFPLFIIYQHTHKMLDLFYDIRCDFHFHPRCEDE